MMTDSLEGLEIEVLLEIKVMLVPAEKESLVLLGKLEVSVRSVKKEKLDCLVSLVCPVQREHVVNPDRKVRLAYFVVQLMLIHYTHAFSVSFLCCEISRLHEIC